MQAKSFRVVAGDSAPRVTIYSIDLRGMNLSILHCLHHSGHYTFTVIKGFEEIMGVVCLSVACYFAVDLWGTSF
jgi:hypothetical protein